MSFPMGAQNLVINGSFEEHDFPYCGLIGPPIDDFDSVCYTGIYPDLIPGFHCYDNYRLFGEGNKDPYFSIFYKDCNLYGDSTTPDGGSTYVTFGEAAPHDTHYAILPTHNTLLETLSTGVSFDLSSQIMMGEWYKVSYYIKIAPQPPSNYANHGDSTFIEVGLSNDSMGFGSQQIHTSPLPDTTWQKQIMIFQANENFDFLTVKAKIIDTGVNVTLIDHIVLSSDTSTSGLENEYTFHPPKQLLRIVDVCGEADCYRVSSTSFCLETKEIKV